MATSRPIAIITGSDSGTGHSEPFVDHDFDAWRHVLRVDLEANRMTT